MHTATAPVNTRDPVRSHLVKPGSVGLVLRWVTTWEYPMLYVFAFFPFVQIISRTVCIRFYLG